ncbi:MAG: TonB-dependent receptor, partial [Pseudomonadota bacterium]
VAIATGDEIDREPLADLYDIVDRIPNVNSSFGGLGFAIRGVDQRGVGGGSGQTLTVYVDDSPLSNSTTFFGPTGSWDLGQVEVYRGPQSTNFGRNALAGSIYIRTRDPYYEPDFKARLEYGEYNTGQIALAGGGALIEDKLAFRLAGEYRESDGFIDNTFLNTDADPVELKSFRGKLLFEPSDTFRAILTTSYTENFGGEDGVALSRANEREAEYDVQGEEGTETLITSLNATWAITDNLELQSITTYQTTDYVRLEDIDVSPAPIGSLEREGEDEAATQELRLKYLTERIAGVIGFYYVDADQEFDDSVTIPAAFLNPQIPPQLLASRDSITRDKTQNLALFVDVEYSLTDTVDLLLGGRLDNEELEDLQITATRFLGEIPPGFEFLRAFEGADSVESDADFDAFLPKLGVRWRTTDDTTLGFVIQKAYRAGGSEINFIDGSIEDFDPEFLWNYEFSVRSSALDNRLRWSANVFYSDWTDQQVPIVIDPMLPTVTRTVNAGESELYGFEAEFDFSVSDQLEFYGSIGYVETEFKDFANPNPQPREPDNFRGNSFPFAPNWSANAGVSYRNERGWFGGVDINYLAEAFSAQDNFPENETDESILINARVGYTFNDHYSVSLYARNLLDEHVVVQRNVEGDFSRIGDPRVVSVRFDMTF